MKTKNNSKRCINQLFFYYFSVFFFSIPIRVATDQCQMGHLMCAACFTHLLADGRYGNDEMNQNGNFIICTNYIELRLRDQVATCPNCRVEISKSNSSRNLAVEKAVSELPSECQVKLKKK